MVGDRGTPRISGYVQAPPGLFPRPTRSSDANSALPQGYIPPLPDWWPPSIPVYASARSLGATFNALYIPAAVTLILAQVGRSKYPEALERLAAFGMKRLVILEKLGGRAALDALFAAG